MAPLKCCVGGCSATNLTHRLFSVPKNDNLRKLWLSFLVPTNPTLLTLSKETLLKKKVCVKHFDRDQFDCNEKRLIYSYPCLFTEREIELGIPLCSSGCSHMNEHNYCQNPENNNEEDSPLSVIPNEDNAIADHTYTEKFYLDCVQVTPIPPAPTR